MSATDTTTPELERPAPAGAARFATPRAVLGSIWVCTALLTLYAASGVRDLVERVRERHPEATKVEPLVKTRSPGGPGIDAAQPV